MRTLVVTAANEAYLPLLRGLIESLHQWQPKPFTDLACFDLGLAPESRTWVAQYAAHLVEPGWDLPVDAALRAEKPVLRALTVRPFLPRYFPGYDAYLWIDADAWVQERSALDTYFSLATRGPLVDVPQVDRLYRHRPRLANWRKQRLQAYYGEAIGSRGLWDTYFNAGVYALPGKSPHWERWAESFRVGLTFDWLSAPSAKSPRVPRLIHASNRYFRCPVWRGIRSHVEDNYPWTLSTAQRQEAQPRTRRLVSSSNAFCRPYIRLLIVDEATSSYLFLVSGGVLRGDRKPIAR